MNLLELEMLSIIDFQMHVDPTQYESFREGLA